MHDVIAQIDIGYVLVAAFVVHVDRQLYVYDEAEITCRLRASRLGSTQATKARRKGADTVISSVLSPIVPVFILRSDWDEASNFEDPAAPRRFAAGRFE